MGRQRRSDMGTLAAIKIPAAQAEPEARTSTPENQEESPLDPANPDPPRPARGGGGIYG